MLSKFDKRNAEINHRSNLATNGHGQFLTDFKNPPNT